MSLGHAADDPVEDAPTPQGVPTTADDTASALALLATGDVELLGRLSDASNLAFLARVVDGTTSALAIYKPVLGERPLWDFPDGTLAERELACFVVSEAAGWRVVPPTVLRDGPHGTGSLQWWVGHPDLEPDNPVDVTPPGRVPEGWLPVLRGEGPDGRPVVVSHEDSPRLREVVTFDVVVNHGDRKGSALLRTGGTVVGVDHGVSLHQEDKLRTVLWGYAGQPLPERELTRLAGLASDLDDRDGRLRELLEGLLTLDEVAALELRVEDLLTTSAYPLPSGGWPSVPWPAF